MDKQKVWSVTVGCLVRYANKVLIIKRPDDEESYPRIWELPGGKVEFGETLIEAVRREVMEETGLKISEPNLCGYFQYQVEKESHTRYTVQINFKADTESKDVKLTEHEDFRFIGLNELDNFRISDKVKEQIKNLFSDQ
jgi:mutator protein MutT